MKTQTITHGTILSLRIASETLGRCELHGDAPHYYSPASVEIVDPDGDGPLPSMSEEGGDLWDAVVLGPQTPDGGGVSGLEGRPVTILIRPNGEIEIRCVGGAVHNASIVSTAEGFALARLRADATKAAIVAGGGVPTEYHASGCIGVYTNTPEGLWDASWSLVDGQPCWCGDTDKTEPAWSRAASLAAGFPT